MPTELHFARSPLTEAVINLQVKLPPDIALEVLTRVQVGNEEEYPTRRSRFEGRLLFDTVTPSATANQVQMGYDFRSKDERHVVQARLDGFAFSRLAPYENWESFRDEARKWWDIYRSIVRPVAVIRTAVRYINRIDIPLPLADFKDYLRTVPEVSSDMPQGLSGYLMQLQIPQTDLEGMLVLNEVMIPPTNPKVVSILLDIDLGVQGIALVDEDIIWNRMEQLRTRKNEIFLACITQRTKDLIS